MGKLIRVVTMATVKVKAEVVGGGFSEHWLPFHSHSESFETNKEGC